MVMSAGWRAPVNFDLTDSGITTDSSDGPPIRLNITHTTQKTRLFCSNSISTSLVFCPHRKKSTSQQRFKLKTKHEALNIHFTQKMSDNTLRTHAN